MDSEAVQFVYNEELYKIPTAPTIVLTKPWDELNADEKDQLTKITNALHQRIHTSLSLDGFRVVVVDRLDLSQWTERPSRLIYFGDPVKGLAPYEVIEAGPSKMVLSEGLSDLIPNEAARAKLWTALKQLFS